jgi:glycosyltransferase involved in cell wall biosynthesis
VGRTRYHLPLDRTSKQKFDALEQVSEVRVLATAAGDEAPGDDTFHLVATIRPRLIDGLVFHLALPFRVARELRDFRPDAVVIQGLHDAPAVLFGRMVARSDARVVADLHGDWRATTRLYGSPLRRAAAPLIDLVTRIGLHRVDGVRTLSDFTTTLVRDEGVEPVAEFPAFVDFSAFRASSLRPLPARPALLFVGVFEKYKAVDVLADAWRLAAPRVPDAELRIVGRGSRMEIVEELLAELPRQTRWYPALPPEEIAQELDDATALVLPSRSEGLPRVVLEAFCRGRPVVGASAGGIVDLVRDDENGVLVEPEDPEALADALVDVLVERERSERLAAAAAASADEWLVTPEEFAERMRSLVAALD